MTGDGPNDTLPEEPPPHPLSKPNSAMHTPSSNLSCTLSLFLKPMKQRHTSTLSAGEIEDLLSRNCTGMIPLVEARSPSRSQLREADRRRLEKQNDG
jgi:hypothetical protein